MITVRQIERLWSMGSYKRLATELVSARAEALFGISSTDRPCCVAAWGMIRLDELSQSHLPFHAKLLHAVLSGQERDGGWGDPVSTALCVRALLLGHGDGNAIERGMTYLANLQKDEGAWPVGPVRRMAADAIGTLFILYQLADNPRFARAVRLRDAVAWFEANQSALGDECRRIWEWVRLRCPAPATPSRTPELFAA